MSTIRAKVVKFTLTPHNNADSLSICLIHNTGWQCVVRTADFQNISLGIYIPIELELKTTRPEFAFLNAKAKNGKFRVKTVRLRGALSQGLLVPALPGMQEGDDVTDLLEIERWEPPIESARLAGDMVREPGAFQKYTSFENYKNYINVLQEGDAVRVTEKIHGCLIFRTKIRMADGTNKPIKHIKIGDKVQGIDCTGNIVNTTVTNTFNNGYSDKWIKISGQRKGLGKIGGKPKFSLYCTPNHPILKNENREYVQAGDLNVGDKICFVRPVVGLSPLQEQILLGMMLGDASYRAYESNCSEIVWAHTKKDIEYNDWIGRGLGDLYCSTSRREIVSGHGSVMIADRTYSVRGIKEKFDSFIIENEISDAYIKNKKIVPAWVAKELTPIAIAFWYMDDGSITSETSSQGRQPRVTFSTQGFSYEDCEILCEGLRKFNLNPKIYKNNSYESGIKYQISLSVLDSELFFLLVAPYIPQCMQRKLPERYRGGDGWLPPADKLQYMSMILSQEVLEIEDVTSKLKTYFRYNIETETNNFIANDIVVHNSNIRFGVIDEGKIDEPLVFYVGTHKTSRDKNGQNIYSSIIRNLHIEEKFSELIDKFKPKTQFIVFGELCGDKIQDLHYGCGKNQQKLYVFDVLLDGQYQPWSTVKEVAGAMGVETAPLLYQGPYSREKVLSLRDGVTTIPVGPGQTPHVREGVVVTAEPEAFHPEIGRKMLKFISDDYLLRKNATDGH